MCVQSQTHGARHSPHGSPVDVARIGSEKQKCRPGPHATSGTRAGTTTTPLPDNPEPGASWTPPASTTVSPPPPPSPSPSPISPDTPQLKVLVDVYLDHLTEQPEPKRHTRRRTLHAGPLPLQ